jgi:hypothetical protein
LDWNVQVTFTGDALVRIRTVPVPFQLPPRLARNWLSFAIAGGAATTAASIMIDANL